MWNIEGAIIIFLGISGFVFLFLYDLASLRKIKNRYIISALGYFIHACAIVLATLADQSLSFPFWIKVVGFVAMLAGIVWLVYCLFLFRPIMRSYFDNPGPQLTTEGPYAISRHPGFLGYVVFIAGLIIVSQSYFLLTCGLIWIFFDLIHIIIQDRWVFRLLFPAYMTYSTDTPMLFPSYRSFRRFIKTAELSKKGGY